MGPLVAVGAVGIGEGVRERVRDLIGDELCGARPEECMRAVRPVDLQWNFTLGAVDILILLCRVSACGMVKAHQLVAIVGRPIAIASITGRPHPSPRDGNTNASAAAYSPAT